MLKLSVPLIVKNEEKRIKDCLDNLTWANEVILVDTGSTDKTIEIARNYPNVTIFEEKFDVYFEAKDKWLFCFDKARNFALSKCTQDYILILDADERIYNPELLEFLMTAEKEKTIDVWYLFQVSRLSNGGTSPCMSTRFWKNHKGIVYSKIVHETVDDYVDKKVAEGLLTRGKAMINIDHVGFLDDEYNAVKSQRVIDAIEYEGHPYMNYYLGVAYSQMRDWDNAIEYLERSVNDVMPFNIRAHAVMILGDVYRQLSEFYRKLAKERIKYSKEICPNQNLSYLISAQIKVSEGLSPAKDLRKIKNRNYGTSDMHQDMLFTDEQLAKTLKEFE